MKLLFTCLLAAAVVTACRKNPVPAPGTPPAPAEQAATPDDAPKAKPAPTGTASGQLKPSNLPAEVEFESSTAYRELSTGLQLFVNHNKRFPADLQEIKAAGFLPNGIPTPPPGLRLVIDQKTKSVIAVRN